MPARTSRLWHLHYSPQQFSPVTLCDRLCVTSLGGQGQEDTICSSSLSSLMVTTPLLEHHLPGSVWQTLHSRWSSLSPTQTPVAGQKFCPRSCRQVKHTGLNHSQPTHRMEGRVDQGRRTGTTVFSVSIHRARSISLRDAEPAPSPAPV